ncbi:MAG: LysR family transcriptional regulator [bacterium]
MRARQIEIFHAIMRFGSITKAAEQLYLTQPAVTTSLKHLEAELGYPLFHRQGKRLQPSHEARILYHEAQNVRESISIFENLAARLKHDLNHHLRLITPTALSHEIIPNALADFAPRSGDSALDFSIQHHEQIIDTIATDRSITGFGLTFGKAYREGIKGFEIGQAKICALIPAQSELYQQEDIAITDLAGMKIIGTFSGEPLNNVINSFTSGVIQPENRLLRVHTHIVAANLVSRNLGFAIVDSFTANYAMKIFSDTAFSVAYFKQAPALSVSAIYNADRPLSGLADELLNCITSHLKDYD